MDATVQVRAGGLVDVVAAPVNDSERDAAPRINAAFQEGALLGNGGVEVQLPPGVFWVKSTVVIPTGCTLKGSGAGTVLKAVAGLNADVIANAAAATAVQIRDLTVDGNRANQTAGNGINLDGADDCVVENVQITSCYGDGLVLSGLNRASVSKVTATDCGSDGIHMVTAVRSVLTDCHAYDNCRVADPDGADGIHLDTTSTDNVIVGADCTDSRNAQEAAPAAPTTGLAGAGAGNVDNGDHKYLVTLVTKWGESDPGTASGTVTVADNTSDGQVALSGIPTGTGGVCTSRNIYRTKAGGSTYYLLATIADNSTTTYTDNTADASLGSSTAPALNTSGKRQGYGVREAAASSCDRNLIVGGSLAGNSTGTVSTVGSNSKLVDNSAVIATVGAPSTQTFGDAASLGASVTAAPLDHKHAMPASVANAALAADVARANLLVNGGLDIWQRGTGAFTANGAYCSDRWLIGLQGSDTLSISQDTANRDSNSLADAACTFVLGNGIGLTALEQKLEDYARLKGLTVSLSVRVKVATANAVRVGIYDSVTGWTYSAYHPGDGTYHTLTVTVALNSGATSVLVGVFFSASCTAYIDNAMLCISPVPVDYVPLVPAEEWARCLRYYEILGAAQYSIYYAFNAVNGVNNHVIPLRYCARKASLPALTKVGTWIVTSCAQPTVGGSGMDGCYVGTTPTGAGYSLFYTNDATQYIVAEANP